MDEDETGQECKRCGRLCYTLQSHGLCYVCHSRWLDVRHRLLDFNPMYTTGFSEALKYHYDNHVEYGDVLQRQDDDRGDEMREEVQIIGGLEKRVRDIYNVRYEW